MANSDKDILITPNTGQASEPTIQFTGAGNNTVTLRVLDDGTISIEGSSGQLFSVTDSLSGTIFSVNDVSGIPSIEVDDNGTVRIAEFGGNVLMGTNIDNGVDKLQVNGSILGTIFRGVATSAYYADLAENYLADADYEAGTVMVFGGLQEITQCSKANDHHVAGVVSTDPAHLMNSGLTGEHVKALALRGRVPVKVVGPVRKGDIIVTSDTVGHGQASNNPDVSASKIIGKAIGTKGDWGPGIVEVLV